MYSQNKLLYSNIHGSIISYFLVKRYYYYAHLRKDHPYVKDLTEGQVVKDFLKSPPYLQAR